MKSALETVGKGAVQRLTKLVMTHLFIHGLKEGPLFNCPEKPVNVTCLTAFRGMSGNWPKVGGNVRQ